MTQKRKSKLGRRFIILLLVGGVAAGVIYYFKAPKSEAVDYKTVALTRGELVQAVTANGGLSPVKNVAVGSQISGTIKEIKADFNSRVKAGDVIAQIDSATYEQSVDQAEAELASAKASLELAELNNKRAVELRKNDLIAASEAEKTLADLHQAQAVVRLREASLKKAKVDLERATIYAPISGIVISRNVDVGQTVAASFNTPTLFQIANDLAKMQIDAMVSEADVGGIEENQPVEFTVDAFPGRPFQGTVKQVRFAPTTNQNVVTYTTVVEVDNTDLKLRPGMTASASIVTARRSHVLRLPNAALRFRPPENAGSSSGTNSPARSRRETNRTDLSPSSAIEKSAPAQTESGGREEMRRRFENMTPEQRQEMREKMRARSGDGGPGAGGGSRRPAGEASTRTIYLLEKKTVSPGGKEISLPKAISVKLGISDGLYTEVLDGLKEGDQIIVGINQTAASKATGVQPPASSPFGGGGFRPR